jgi:hypothetical protein
MWRRYLISASLISVSFATLQTASLAQQAGTGHEARSVVTRARVWRPTDIASMDLRVGPQEPGAFAPGATITCTYLDKKMSGASPKFACRLPDGDEVKVKYGGENGEVYAEVASSRLLWALGFGADHMYSVRVICRGCPETHGSIRRENGDRIIDPAAVERKIAGRELAQKWDWQDLELIDEKAGGASRAHVDAFKLLAVLLQHSDNKALNQRIVCADASDDRTDCQVPLIMIQDLGVTFGRANMLNQQPRGSVNFAEWSSLPIWRDPQKCVGRLSSSWTGTLKDPVVSEEGRRFLANLLSQLSDEQIRDMFDVARVQLRPRAPSKGRSGFPTVDEWLNAFKQKRAQIVDHRCPASPTVFSAARTAAVNVER